MKKLGAHLLPSASCSMNRGASCTPLLARAARLGTTTTRSASRSAELRTTSPWRKSEKWAGEHQLRPKDTHLTFIPPEEVLTAGLDEDTERYYATAPAGEELDEVPMRDFTTREVNARIQTFEQSLPARHDKSARTNPVVFHYMYTEEFVDVDDDLTLPPRLKPGQSVSVMQVVRLLRHFHHTRDTRTPEANRELLDQVLGLIDRIVIRLGVQSPAGGGGRHDPQRAAAWHRRKQHYGGNDDGAGAGGDDDDERLFVNERYAEHVYQRSTLPAGNTIQNWRTLLTTLADIKQVDKAFELFESLERRFRIMPNMPLFIDMWRVCREARRSDKALEYMDYLFECRSRTVGAHHWANVHTFNIILKAVNDAQGVLRVIAKMRREGTEPNAATYARMITVMTESRQINTALDYYEAMKVDGFSPSLDTYLTLMQGVLLTPTDPEFVHDHSRRSRVERVRLGLKRVDRTERSKEEDEPQVDHLGGDDESGEASYEQLDHTYHLIQNLFHELEQRHEPNHEAYSLLLRTCAQLGRADKAFEVFEQMQQKGHPPLNSHMLNLIAACGTSWQADKALDLFWQMDERYALRPTPGCFNALIVALVRAGRYDLIEPTVAHAHEAFGLSPWPKTSAFVLYNALLLEDLEYGQAFADMLLRDFPVPAATHRVQNAINLLHAKQAAAAAGASLSSSSSPAIANASVEELVEACLRVPPPLAAENREESRPPSA